MGQNNVQQDSESRQETFTRNKPVASLAKPSACRSSGNEKLALQRGNIRNMRFRNVQPTCYSPASWISPILDGPCRHVFNRDHQRVVPSLRFPIHTGLFCPLLLLRLTGDLFLLMLLKDLLDDLLLLQQERADNPS